jgi:uncharacterized integral membrane protein
VSGEYEPLPETEPFPSRAEAEPRGIGGAFLIGAILAAALVTFGFQNTASVPIRFLWFDGELPLWIAMGLAVVAAVVLSVLVAVVLLRSRKRRRQRQAMSR